MDAYFFTEGVMVTKQVAVRPVPSLEETVTITLVSFVTFLVVSFPEEEIFAPTLLLLTVQVSENYIILELRKP